MTDDLRATPEFQSYLRARDAVLRMKQVSGEAAAAVPSAYWTEELENIDYLIDASPLIVRKLRHHASHITGIRPYDYRDRGNGRRDYFEARLRELRSLVGEALLVPESPALGGFGYQIDGRLFNVDTLKYFEVLAGMQRGGVIDAVRAIDRPVVCEIGAGWGGFAYQFKTLFPGTTYVIVDLPELFLFSATYLGAVFPAARILFAEPDTVTLEGWRDADFIFVPNTRADLVTQLSLDLMVNMVSFQEMTEAQVSGYGEMAARAGCPLLYSLNRERSQYNTELVSVTNALSRWYALTPVHVLDTDYTHSVKRFKPGPVSRFAYHHQVGRLLARPGAGDTSAAAAGRGSAGAPRAVLGMTLYNNAGHLREALDSLLGQTFSNFVLLLLDDASSDDTEAIAREYVDRDARVRYVRHATRRAMIATWREVAESAIREFPNASFFAWVSDHDRWAPTWLERMVFELDSDPGVVLAYPITRRIAHDGVEIDKGDRLFDTASLTDLQGRWAHFCANGVGAGDMVYGLMRIGTLLKVGVFRTVLRPDRLLIAELTLHGRIRQVPEILWFRRQSGQTSVERQRHTLVLAGEEPRGFQWLPWLQHTRVLWREYALRQPPPLPMSRAEWRRMLLRYQLAYGWRHFRKSETSHTITRGIDSVVYTKKVTKHHYHHAVYNTLVGGRAALGRTRRLARRAVYELLMLTHRLGLRGRGHTP